MINLITLKALLPQMGTSLIEHFYDRLGCNHALVDLVVSQINQKPQKALPYTWAAEMAKTHISGFVCQAMRI